MIATRGTLVAMAVATAIGIAGCGGSDPEYCTDRSALQASISDLRDVDVRADGVGALETQLRQIQSDANALVASAREEFEPEASSLRAALTRVETAGQAVVADPSAQAIPALAAAVSSMVSAFDQLSDAVRSRC